MRVHWPLLIMVSIFLAPAIGAGYLLLFDHKINFNSSEYGSLIQNPSDIGLVTADHKWHIVHVSEDICDEVCDRQERSLQRVQRALGADASRVNIVKLTKRQLPLEIKPNSILIINPRGLYIMYYDANADHMGLLKDLRRLLKYSHAHNTK